MKNNPMILSIAIILLLVHVMYGEQDNPTTFPATTAASQPSNQIVFEITVDNATRQVLATIKNNSGHVLCTPSVNPGYWFDISVTDGNGKAAVLTPAGELLRNYLKQHPGPLSGPAAIINAGSTHEWKISMDEIYDLLSPGIYTIKCGCSVIDAIDQKEIHITSDAVKMEVKPIGK